MRKSGGTCSMPVALTSIFYSITLKVVMFQRHDDVCGNGSNGEG